MFGIRETLVAAGAVAVTTAALWAYDVGIDDPAVRREARTACVSEAELKAKDAQLALEQKRRVAAEHALAAYTKRAADDQAEANAYAESLEQEISENEKLLAQAGRACVLDQRDIDWLLNPSKAP